MKILHIISGGDTGGAKTHVLSLLQGLKETQTVHMLCFVESEFTREARERGIPMTVYREAVTPGLIRRIVRRVREERYEVIHCHGAKGNVEFFLYGTRFASGERADDELQSQVTALSEKAATL